MEFFVIILIIVLGVAIVNWYLNEKTPEEQVEAVLIKKKKVSLMDANNVMYDDFFLIFEANGETKKFKVNCNTYKQYNENQKGVLSFKRKRFVSFTLI